MEREQEEADAQLCHMPRAGYHQVITKVERHEHILAFVLLGDAHT